MAVGSWYWIVRLDSGEGQKTRRLPGRVKDDDYSEIEGVSQSGVVEEMSKVLCEPFVMGLIVALAAA